jgi:hypothetical protein
MANEKTVFFVFNSALTQLDKATGKFDDGEHRKMILPLRGKIMQIDGVTGCFIARYAVRVEIFLPAADEADIQRQVIQIFEDAANEGFFPLRGDKQVKITFEK